MISIFAGISGLAGMALLYGVWLDLVKPAGIGRLSAVLFLMGSVGMWVNSAGTEFGIIYFITAVPFIAWVAVALQTHYGTRKPMQDSRRSMEMTSWSTLSRHLWLFVLALPVAGIVSALLSASITSLLPWAEVNRLALLTLLMPTLWGLLMLWCCIEENVLLPAVIIFALGTCAGVYLFG